MILPKKNDGGDCGVEQNPVGECEGVKRGVCVCVCEEKKI